MFTKLQTKISIIVVLILLVTIGTNNIIGSKIFNDEYERVLKREILVLGRNLKQQVDMVMSYGMDLEDIMGFEEQCLNLKKENSEVVLFASLIDIEGKILFHDDVDKMHKNLDKSEQIVVNAINSKAQEEFVKYENSEGNTILAAIIPIKNNENKESESVGGIVLGMSYSIISDRIANYNGNLMMVSFFFILLSVLLIMLVISLWVTKPVKKLIAMMIEAGNGNFTIKTSSKLKDEIGQAFNSFDKMISNIRLLIARVSGSSTEVENFASMLSDTSRNFYTISDQIALTVQEVAKGASEQSGDISQIMNYMNDFSTGMNKVENDIQTVSSIVNASQNLGNNAMQAVKSLNDKASETVIAAERILGDVNLLNENIDKISSIASVINGITAQTNLLAFNATIEAAKAGEAGKGFTVVALEIKKLANRSKQAVETINAIVNSIFVKTESTFDAANNTKILMEAQMNAVIDTNSAFKTIFEHMENITEQINKMRDSITSISNLKLQTLKGMDSILVISNQSAAITEEVSSSTEAQISGAEELTKLASKLDYMAKDLNKLVSVFKI